MILPALALLGDRAATPERQLRTGLGGLDGLHRGEDRAVDRAARVANRVLTIEPRGSARAGVQQTVYLTPGSLWRIGARTSGNALIEAQTLSGSFGSSRGPELIFRTPSPGEVAIHLDSDRRAGYVFRSAL